MKTILSAVLFSIAAMGTVSAAGLTDMGGGFAYSPIGDGRCQVLTDVKSGQPILQTSKRSPSKVVLIGTGKDCPKEYAGYEVIRIISGRIDGFIYTGVFSNHRRLYIYRKFGSNFSFRYETPAKKTSP